MPRRKTVAEDIIDILQELLIPYVAFLILFWIAKRDLFWKMLIGGIIFCIIAFIGVLLYKKSKIHKQSQWRTDRELIIWLRGLKPWEFEQYVADLFTKLGYRTNVVGGSYDKGIDVIAEKDGIKHYIQCKKYITSVVGVNEVRDFYGALADHLANGKGYFITTNKFTLEAEKFAEDKPIELIDGNKLIKYIRMVENQTKKSNLPSS